MRLRERIGARVVMAWIAVAPVSAATLEIVAPDANEILYGPTRVLVRFDGDVTPVKMQFYLDTYPRAVCTVSDPPYECHFDAGEDFQGHRIRVRAVNEVGGTIAESVVETLAFPVPERVVLRTLEVPVVATGTATVAPALIADTLSCRFADKPCRVVDVRSIIEAAVIPLSLEMLIDVSGSVETGRDELLEALELVIDTAPVGVDIATTEFGGTYSRVGEFTQDKDALRRAVTSLSAGQQRTCLVAAMQRSLRTLMRLPGHKLLFVISDGEENCVVNRRRKESALAYADAMWDVVSLSREVGVPIYIYRYQNMNDIDRPRSSFAKSYEGVARESGGRLFAFGSVTSLTDALTELIEDLHNTWVVDLDLPDLEHVAWKRRLSLETSQPEVSLRYPEYWRAEHREEELIGMLESPDPGTRGWAAEQVEFGRSREVIGALIRAARKEKRADVLDAELSALQRASATLLIHGTAADQKDAVRAIEVLHAADPGWLTALVPVMRVFPEVAATDKLRRRVEELRASN